MDRLTREEVAGAVARGYCTTANMHKELDADLVTGITNEVMALQSLSQEAVRDEALEEAAKVCDENAALNRAQPDYGKGNEKSAMAWAFVDRAEFLAKAIRALKREPNAAGQAQVAETGDSSVRGPMPAPAAPVAEMVERLLQPHAPPGASDD